MEKRRSNFVRRGVLCLLALLSLSVTAFSQTRTVTGKVTGSKDSQPLAGVTVTVKGSNISTQTNAEGTFSINVPQNAKALTFSFVGHQAQEVIIGSSNNIEANLVPSAKSLEDVVVVGYGTLKRKEVTSAVTSVKPEDFNQGGSRSPLDLIQGKVAGLTITRTGGNNPNSGVSIQLRGVTSFRGTNSPLVVIDGIPGGNLDLLQQDDIASFDVLKDGSAAAIYGTRGTSGVILITTKKGKAGEVKFDYNTYVQREFIAKKPDFLTPDEYRAVVAPANDLKGNADIYDMLIDKQNTSQYHNFAVTGGSVNSNYRASLYYNDAKGIAIKNSRNQYGGRLSINQRGLNNMLTLQATLATNYNKANLLGGSDGDFEQAIQRNPTAPVFNPDGTYLETNAFNNYNPIARLNQELSERDQQTTSADAKVTLEPIKGLRFSAFGALIRDNYTDRAYRLRESRSSQQTYQGTGYASKSNRLQVDKTFESTIDYSKTFGEDHSLNAILGYSYQYSTVENYNLNNSGFPTNAFEDWNMGAGTAITNTSLPRPGLGSSKEDNTLIAFLGRVNYAYQGKYIAQVILRREGSSRFGDNYKWGYFPAVSAGWVLSDENFMRNIEVVNNLKLRVGYGITGNQGFPNYQSMVTLSTGGFYLQNGVWAQTYGVARNPNPDLRWEKKKELNIGVDFSLLNYRLNGSIDVYSRRTEDILEQYSIQQPAFVLADVWANVGTMSNKGIEIAINAIPVKTKNFTWSIDFTANTQNNKLVSFSNGDYKTTLREFGGLPSPGNLGNTIRLTEGAAIGGFYGKRFAGFTDDGKWLFYKKDGSKAAASAMTTDDLTWIGNGVPKYMVSLSQSFTYKNFDLMLFFRGKFDYDILNTQDLFFGSKKWLPNNLLKSALTKHAKLNDDPQYSDYYLEKGDFVKLDNITIGYTIKLKTKYIRNLRVYATGRNIATITGYDGLDPELQDTGFTTGIDNRGFYPRTMSFAFGLNLGF